MRSVTLILMINRVQLHCDLLNQITVYFILTFCVQINKYFEAIDFSLKSDYFQSFLTMDTLCAHIFLRIIDLPSISARLEEVQEELLYYPRRRR